MNLYKKTNAPTLGSKHPSALSKGIYPGSSVPRGGQVGKGGLNVYGSGRAPGSSLSTALTSQLRKSTKAREPQAPASTPTWDRPSTNPEPVKNPVNNRQPNPIAHGHAVPDWKGGKGWFRTPNSNTGWAFINAQGVVKNNAIEPTDRTNVIANPFKRPGVATATTPAGLAGGGGGGAPVDPAPWQSKTYYTMPMAEQIAGKDSAWADYEYRKKMHDLAYELMGGKLEGGTLEGEQIIDGRRVGGRIVGGRRVGGELQRSAEQDFYTSNASQAARGIHSSGMREVTDLRRKQRVEDSIRQLDMEHGSGAQEGLLAHLQAALANFAQQAAGIEQNAKEQYQLEHPAATEDPAKPQPTPGKGKPAGAFRRDNQLWWRNAQGNEAPLQRKLKPGEKLVRA